MQRLILHSIDDRNRLPFSKQHYSEFKYGHATRYTQFSNELTALISGWLNTFETKLKKVVIYGAPYNKIPAASNLLCELITKKLSKKHSNIRFINGYIKREYSYHEDYGKMNGEDRRKMLQQEKFEFHHPPKDTDFAIFLDDVFISGAHEEMILSIIDKAEFKIPFVTAYYAKLNDPNCPASFESELNLHAFESTTKTDFFNNHILWNTRNVKFILSMDEEEFKQTVRSTRSRVNKWNKLIKAAEKNGYHEHPLYSTNYKFLKQFI